MFFDFFRRWLDAASVGNTQYNNVSTIIYFLFCFFVAVFGIAVVSPRYMESVEPDQKNFRTYAKALLLAASLVVLIVIAGELHRLHFF
jgi:hypothetical protein